MIYLDYTANMPAAREALNAFVEAEARFPGNPNAHHAAGREAAAYLRDVTEGTAALLGVRPEEIIFTSGASESNSTAILGLAYAARHIGRHILTTPLEHASVSGCLTFLQEQGYEVDVLHTDRQGRLDLDELNELLRPDTVLLTLCAVDSELGIPQPVREARELLSAHPQCRLHVDATQAPGKMAFDYTLADTVSLSAHKFGGLNGSGLLIKKSGVAMEPLIHGGVSSTLYRSGTPAVALAASLRTALSITQERLDERLDTVRALNARLRKALAARPGITVYSPENAVPHILNLGVSGIRGSAMRDKLDRRGICVSVKSACSVENTPSRAVYALTGQRRAALEAFRVSLSHQTTEEEIARLIEAIDEIRTESTI
ncbi:MAG: aminotransferase class V-fold PLP-dependent enzyme [Clostridia bacterium]|nr:aminotransferase class V-fold PLP-dependent enzyme [Clostridia bacterium]